MVNDTDCYALRLSRKLGTSLRGDDCARRTCDKETKMRSTTETFPRKDTDFFWYSVAVGERTGWERRRWTRERTNRVCEIYIGCFDYGLVARCVLRNFYGWYMNKMSFLFKLWKTWTTFFQNKKKVGEEKTWSLFSIFRLVRVSDFWVQNFLVWSFCSIYYKENYLQLLFVQQIIYNFSSICTVNVTNSPSLTAIESHFWRDPLLRQCFSIST